MVRLSHRIGCRKAVPRLLIRLWPALAVLIVTTVTVWLGFWQRDRAHQKEVLYAQRVRYQNEKPIKVDATPIPLRLIEFHRVIAWGHFMPQQVVYLDNRLYRDQPGFYVVMLLALKGGGYVLVNRGWLPRNTFDRTAIAPYNTSQGEIEVTGIARANPGRMFELGHSSLMTGVAIRQNLKVDEFARETGLRLQPFVIQQTNEIGDQLIRDWPAPTVDASRNYGYMVQWWGIAAATLLLGLYTARRAARDRDQVESQQKESML